KPGVAAAGVILSTARPTASPPTCAMALFPAPTRWSTMASSSTPPAAASMLPPPPNVGRGARRQSSSTVTATTTCWPDVQSQRTTLWLPDRRRYGRHLHRRHPARPGDRTAVDGQDLFHPR